MAGLTMSQPLPCSRCGFAAGSRLQPRHMPAPARARTPLCVEAKRSKAADFRGLSLEQIEQEVNKAKRALFDLRMKQKTRQEFKTHEFGEQRLKIAQLLTVAREKEIADGLTDRREWRRKQKQKNIAAGFPQF